ncbi:sigma-70 family RNA polymerase sigma factor [Streptomyces huiliensis]|uniref:sigma-70 family RNA polymerase sigma factor n=1 Tax=Streptomyces huiliensis TaxID=2876027 RepID=UPI001CBDB6B8|nr:sigma-70 family RNA polymerase sigma factor [Streptomyces huiliensis]MBZ4323166.1 sigma-70 family RNA polymerase sigma factor [Streptomyces huiliensis]
MMTSRYEQPPHAPGGSRPPHRAAAAPRPSVVTPAPDDPPPPVAPHVHLARATPHLDGLYTYCLFLLHEPDMATCALAEALSLAERRADRTPPGPPRPWLYALARWACRRRLAAGPAGAFGPGEAPRAAGPAGPRARPLPFRHAETDPLAWPEAAGTDAVQREALELSVRHGLPSHDVATVLRLDPDTTRALLAGAACEVERTRTALAVVAAGRCRAVARFAVGGDTGAPLGPAVRRALVRHVDDCADCRRTAERVTADEPWPGTAAPRAELPLLKAPLTALQAALRHARATRPGSPRYDREGYPLPPADRSGRRSRLRHRAVTTTVVATVAAAPALALWAACRETPSGGRPGAGTGEGAVTAEEAPTDDPTRPSRAPVPDPGDEERAGDREETRVVGDSRGDGDSRAASDSHAVEESRATGESDVLGDLGDLGDARDGDVAGDLSGTAADLRGGGESPGPGRSGRTGSSGTTGLPARSSLSGPPAQPADSPGPGVTDTPTVFATPTPRPIPHPAAARTSAPPTSAPPDASHPGPWPTAFPPAPQTPPGTRGSYTPRTPPDLWPGFGRLTVAAQPSGSDTLVTVTAVGGEVHWAATPGAAWLRLGRTGGVLLPGRSLTFTVATDPDREPAGPWRTQVRLAPGPATVPVDGPGRLRRTEAT